jgi:integrase
MPRKPHRKAANGKGTVRWNDERNRYEYRMTVGFKTDGTAIRKMVTAKTQDELEHRINLAETVAKADAKLSTDLSVAEFLKYWANDVLPLADVTQSTRESYAYNVRLYVIPNLPRSGRIPLTELTPAHVRSMIAALAKQGKSTNTQRLARSTLRRALRTAEVDGLVPRNVAALVDGVKQEYREGRTMTIEQAKALLAYVKGHDLEAAVLIMLSLGLRRGELAGLTWDDVNLPDEGDQNATLRVVRAVKKSAAV